ncbi:hypothetical protein LTR78_008920 [Recurvomyces mirabilis]|uniref:Uncharacterized protein n=1 Tax=Recurvomyces mirabilis TaxID=574656 RepID=A0AAE0TQB8_9PEZI|nr:hypothetical protein LTR78_008920 [Recurvomyces mirabilis]
MAIHEIQGFEVPFLPSGRQFANTWTDFEPDKRVVLPRGWKREGRRPLPEAIVWLKDVAVELRDGVKIRADIFRPASRENERLPAIIPWSPYAMIIPTLLLLHRIQADSRILRDLLRQNGALVATR